MSVAVAYGKAASFLEAAFPEQNYPLLLVSLLLLCRGRRGRHAGRLRLSGTAFRHGLLLNHPGGLPVRARAGQAPVCALANDVFLFLVSRRVAGRAGATRCRTLLQHLLAGGSALCLVLSECDG
jgi:hypothetical protein